MQTLLAIHNHKFMTYASNNRAMDLVLQISSIEFVFELPFIPNLIRSYNVLIGRFF
jgi:hypothetical protein